MTALAPLIFEIVTRATPSAFVVTVLLVKVPLPLITDKFKTALGTGILFGSVAFTVRIDVCAGQLTLLLEVTTTLEIA